MKKARETLWLSFAALVLLLSLWWLQRGAEVAPLSLEPTTVANEATPSSATPATATPPAPERSAAVEATAPTPKVEALATFEVLVVDAVTQQPVADVEVCWSDAAAREQVSKLPKDQAREFRNSSERMAERFGRRARSDRDGRFRVALDQRVSQLFARNGERYGELSIDTDGVVPAGGYRLLLARDEQGSVRVLDAAGRPAENARVGLSLRSAASFAKRPRYDVVVLTDAAGLATFTHLQVARTRHRPAGSVEASLGCLVGLAIPGLPEMPVVLDHQAPWPKDPVELRLPPTASLRLRYTAAGEPIQGLDFVRVHDGRTIGTDQHNRSIGETVDADGWAWFRWLPASVPLLAEPSSEVVMHRERLALPELTIGEVVEHRIDLATDAPVLRGRALNAEGKAMTNSPLQVFCGIDRADTRVRLQTDDQGRFQVVFWKPSSPQPWFLEVELVSTDREELRIELPRREVQLGVNELGDLRFGSEPLVCAGRLDGYVPRRHETRMWFERQEVDPQTGTLTWRAIAKPKVGLGKDGAFVARGRIGPGRHRLNVLSRDYLPVAPIEFTPGQDDLVVPMHSGASLEVACQLPAKTDAQQLVLELVGGPARAWMPVRAAAGGPPTDNRRGHAYRVQGDTAGFRWSAVEPGTYSLGVFVAGCAEPALAVDDVVLPLPPEGDPRLVTIDLRPALRWVTLRLLDSSGQSLAGPANVFPQPQADAQQWSGALLEGEVSLVLLPTRAQSILVVCDRRRPTSVVVPADVLEHRIQVEEWPWVEVSVAGPSALPAGCDLHAVVRPSSSRANGSFEVRHPVGGGGSGSLSELLRPKGWSQPVPRGGQPFSVVVGDGPSTLSFVLERGGRQQALKRFTPSEVVAGAPVTITLDAEEVAAAAAALAAPGRAK